MIFKNLMYKLFGRNEKEPVELLQPKPDEILGFPSKITEEGEIDPESIRLENWLKDNYQEGYCGTEREMIISTGTDFLTNQPILDSAPRIYESREPKRKHQYGNSTVNDENFSTRVTDEGGTKVRYLFQKNPDWVKCLLEDGELYISSHEHNGKKTSGLRGRDLAKGIASSLKQYLRNELNTMNPDVRVVPGSGRDARIIMSEKTHRRYTEKIYTNPQYATA